MTRQTRRGRQRGADRSAELSQPTPDNAGIGTTGVSDIENLPATPRYPRRHLHRYTREILQQECVRWTKELGALGYRLPDTPIRVYTSSVEFEGSMDNPPSTTARVTLECTPLGMAAWSGGSPIVFVRLRHHDGPVVHDPLEVLIHELLHHVTPKLSHEDMFRLAGELRASDPTPTAASPRRRHPEPSPRPTPTLTEAEQEARFEELRERLWLDANGFPSDLPPRSQLTGRFVKAARGGRVGMAKKTLTKKCDEERAKT